MCQRAILIIDIKRNPLSDKVSLVQNIYTGVQIIIGISLFLYGQVSGNYHCGFMQLAMPLLKISHQSLKSRSYDAGGYVKFPP